MADEPVSLKTLVRARDDAVYAVRQIETKAYNMRTWAISSRRTDGSQSKKMSQWDTDAQDLEVDSRPMIHLPTSVILEARKVCPVRPTTLARQEIINKFKPGGQANMAVHDILASDAETFVSKVYHPSKLAPESVLPPPSYGAHLMRDVLLPLQDFEAEQSRQQQQQLAAPRTMELPTALANDIRTYGPRTALHKGTTLPHGTAVAVSPFTYATRSVAEQPMVPASGSPPQPPAPDDDYFDEASLRPPVKTAAPSMAETGLPEHNLVSYVDLYTEQQILKEQQEIHREAYEMAKQLYADECRFVKSSITAMAEGRFFDHHEGAVGTRYVPVVELEKMRLQRDSVPVMFVKHDE